MLRPANCYHILTKSESLLLLTNAAIWTMERQYAASSKISFYLYNRGERMHTCFEVADFLLPIRIRMMK